MRGAGLLQANNAELAYVPRCPSCDAVMLRFVRGPGRAWLDLRGLSYLQVAVPDEA